MRPPTRYLATTLAIALLLSISIPGRATAQQPTATAPDRRFGVVEAFWRPEESTALGIGWQRVIFFWRDLQPRGPDDWNANYFPDPLLDAEIAAGRQVVGLLIGTPAWASAAGNGDPRNLPAGLNLPLDDPKNHWARFVRTIVQRYRGKIDHWIVWNEPDVWGEALQGNTWNGTEADYYLLLKTAYRAAKSANPNVTILFSGLTYWWDAKYNREQFLERVLRVADQDQTALENGYYFDVLPMHLYNVVPYIPYVVNRFRTILAAHGLSKPLWINEMNVVPYDDPAQPLDRMEARSTLQEQTHFMIQATALALAEGVERISVYKMIDDATIQPGFEPYGLLRKNRQVRPVYDAYRTAIQQFGGTRAARDFTFGSVEGVLLDRGDRTTLVLWSWSGQPQTVTVEAGFAERRSVDASGTFTQPVETSNSVGQPVEGAVSSGRSGDGPTVDTGSVGAEPARIAELPGIVDRARLVEPTGSERDAAGENGRFNLVLTGATREWPAAELAPYTIGGKPAILVFDTPVEAVRIRAAAGLAEIRRGSPDALLTVEITLATPPADSSRPADETASATPNGDSPAQEPASESAPPDIPAATPDPAGS